MIASIILMAFAAIMAFAAVSDLMTMTIPNKISIALTAAFVVSAPVFGLSINEFLMHLAAGALVLAVGIVLFAIGGFGGGDAKLLAVGALWIGFDQLLLFLTLTTIMGGFLTLAILHFRRFPFIGIHAPEWAIKLHRRGSAIPYGIAIAAAGLVVLPVTPWVVTAAG